MDSPTGTDLVTLDPDRSLWERVFVVAPLVVIGTAETDGSYDLAPKHMATPLGWGPYFGFVCTPRHATYRNAKRDGAFTVTFVRPSQVVLAALAAAPRSDGKGADGPGAKPSLQTLDTTPASVVRGQFLADGYLFLECELEQVVDGFGENSLIAGRIVAAHAHPDSMRISDADEAERLAEAPLLAYLHPGRYAEIAETHAFPFPAGFKR
jgi:flavin reductase (DIM6/NTAB) family NADH-FMN oxidoreductase RutF